MRPEQVCVLIRTRGMRACAGMCIGMCAHLQKTDQEHEEGEQCSVSARACMLGAGLTRAKYHLHSSVPFHQTDDSAVCYRLCTPHSQFRDVSPIRAVPVPEICIKLISMPSQTEKDRDCLVAGTLCVFTLQ